RSPAGVAARTNRRAPPPLRHIISCGCGGPEGAGHRQLELVVEAAVGGARLLGGAGGGGRGGAAERLNCWDDRAGMSGSSGRMAAAESSRVAIRRRASFAQVSRRNRDRTVSGVRSGR